MAEGSGAGLEDGRCSLGGDTDCEVTRLGSNEAVRQRRLSGDLGCEATQAVGP